MLDGRFFLDGRPEAGWSVSLSPLERPSGRPSEHPQSSTDPAGRFRLETHVEGPHRLTLASEAFVLQATVTLTDGETPWLLDLETAQVRVEGLPTAAAQGRAPGPHLVWSGPDGSSARIDLTAGPDGTAVTGPVPCGQIELRVPSGGRGMQATTAAELELAPGEVGRLVHP